MQDDWRRRVGSTRQVGRSELLEFQDGVGRGSRQIRLTSAWGFDVEILPDRGFDLGAVLWRGIPLAWLSAAGPVAPSLLEQGSAAWRRGFGGGLLTTCGYDQFGHESEDEGELFPMHGRAHTLAADDVVTWTSDRGETAELGATGTVRHVDPFGAVLALRREVRTEVGGSWLRISDTLSNESFVTAGHMILYHLNFGWPIVDESTTVEVRHQHFDGASEMPSVHPLDDRAAAALSSWSTLAPPMPGREEELFCLPRPRGASTTVSLTSPRAGLRVEVAILSEQLTHVFVWKMLSEGVYALGIEPASSSAIAGRAHARQDGSLIQLESQGSRSYFLEFRVTPLG